MRHYSFFLAILGILVSFISCKKNDYSAYPPTWKGFQFTRDGQAVNPRTGIYAGDIVTVTALQDQKGRYIEKTVYTWNVKGTIQLENGSYDENYVFFEDEIPTNYDGTDNGDPSIQFTIPQNAIGQATVSFKADYRYYGNGIQVSDGGTYDNSSSTSGSIHSTSSATWGGATGSVRFKINNR